MAEHQVLFCPFCRESFEGVRRCPEHDLALVPYFRLPPDPSELPRLAEQEENEPVAAVELRFGRGYVALGGAANALSLLLDFVRLPDGRGLSTLLLASALPALWTLGLASFTLFFVLHRRRTLPAMRAMRVLVPMVACVSPATVLWELHRLRHGAAAVWLTRGAAVEAGPAPYVVCVAALLVFYGGLRLGVINGKG